MCLGIFICLKSLNQRMKMQFRTGSIFCVLVFSLFSLIECFRNESARVIIGYSANLYDFPWLCSVTSGEYFVSTCTIIQSKYVVVSVDNLNQKIPGKTTYFYQSMADLRIHAGTDQRIPKITSGPFYQVRTPFYFYVPVLSHVNNPNYFEYEINPKNFDKILRNVYGVALNIGLLHFHTPLKWSSQVLPAPLPTGDADSISKKIQDFLRPADDKPLDQTPCVVGSFQKSKKPLALTKVVYVPIQSCREAYCVFDSTNCLVFPHMEQHRCFKSLMFVDMCPSDRGAAVYCPAFGGQVLGILTTAVNCGAYSLPCVYTSIDYVERLFKRIVPSGWEPPPDREKYTTRRP